MVRVVVALFALGSLTLPLRAAPIPAPVPPAPGVNFHLEHPTLAMIWVRPGTFMMSSTFGTGDDTEVTLTQGYWLGQTEVTQAQWQAIMDSFPLPSIFKGSERPVENVAWGIVAIFCEKLTAREQAAGRLPAGYVYTLPTETQWEYACRAGTTGIYAGEIDAMAWHLANSGGETHPVAQKQPNVWGFYDMHGNVQEWCADWYGGYPGGKVSDPTGVKLGQFRTKRGGSWDSPAEICRSALRSWLKPNLAYRGIGFRVALAPVRHPSAPDK